MEQNISKYMAFVKTVELGTISKAAEELHYSQSGISRMIADLESEWKVTLIERGKSGVRLTGDGTKLLPFAKNVCVEFDKLLGEVSALSGLSEGLIRIAAIPGIEDRIGEKIALYNKEHEEIEFEIKSGTYTEVEDMVSTGKADIGFTRIPLKNDLESEFLFQDVPIAVVPEEWAEGNLFEISRVSEIPFILIEGSLKEELEDLFRDCNVTPSVRYRVSSIPEALALLKERLGMTILSENSLRSIRSKQGLSFQRLDVPTMRNIGYAVKSRKSASIACQKFMEVLSGERL